MSEAAQARAALLSGSAICYRIAKVIPITLACLAASEKTHGKFFLVFIWDMWGTYSNTYPDLHF